MELKQGQLTLFLWEQWQEPKQSVKVRLEVDQRSCSVCTAARLVLSTLQWLQYLEGTGVQSTWAPRSGSQALGTVLIITCCLSDLICMAFTSMSSATATLTPPLLSNTPASGPLHCSFLCEQCFSSQISTWWHLSSFRPYSNDNFPEGLVNYLI
jgi:hypothetical protein